MNSREMCVSIIVGIRRYEGVVRVGESLGINLPEMQRILEEHGFRLNDRDAIEWDFAGTPGMTLQQAVSRVESIEAQADKIMGFKWWPACP